MDDAVTRYRTASKAGDIEGIMATLAHDPELVSPISGRMVFRGEEDLRVLLTAVYGSMTGLRWRGEVGDGSVRPFISKLRLDSSPRGDHSCDTNGLKRRHTGRNKPLARQDADRARSEQGPKPEAGRRAESPGTKSLTVGQDPRP